MNCLFGGCGSSRVHNQEMHKGRSRRCVISIGFQARDNKPPLRTSAVDQLLRAEARSRPQIGKVTLDRARTNAKAGGRARDGSAAFDESTKRLALALGGPGQG